MLKTEVHQLASKELDDAIEWYNLQAEDLGNHFQNEVVSQVKKIRVDF